MDADTITATRQLEFLQKVQRLLESGRFTSTYKFALLIALTNVAVEKGDDSAREFEVDLDDVAREFISLYWSHARPYKPVGEVLAQNRERLKSAKVLSLLAGEVGISKGSHSRSRVIAGKRARLVGDVRELIVRYPLECLQNLESISDKRYGRDQFLYSIGEVGSTSASLQFITLKPGVAACLRSLRGVVVALVQARWAQWVRERNPKLGKDRGLEEFMFGGERGFVADLAPRLYELQGHRCFYTGGKLNGPKSGEVDHFIAWSRYSSDDPLNLVLASKSANNSKHDHLASTRHLREWINRNARFASDLETMTHDRAEVGSAQSARAIACWAYGCVAAVGSPVWDAPKKFVQLDRSWKSLLAG